jgi:hypothetical protein
MEDEQKPQRERKPIPAALYTKEEQIDKMELVQTLVLDDMVETLLSGTATATDRATFIRFLQQNGWTLDPSRIPTKLKDKLTSNVRFDKDLSEEETGAPKLKLG